MRRTSWCLWICLLTASCLVLATALEWSLVDALTVFLLAPFFTTLWFALAGCSVWAGVHWMLHRRSGWYASGPLLVCFAAALVVLLVPFTDLWVQANFHLLRGRREEVVRQVRAGILVPKVEHMNSLISLGSTFPTLSMGGNEIHVEEHGGRQYVFFFTYRGILDNYSGFLCVPEGGDPREFSDLGETESTQLVPFGGCWFFAAHR